jgi:hypothetical protein
VRSASKRSHRVEKLDQAISVVESLNGSGTPQNANQPSNIRCVTAQDGAGTTGEMGKSS